MSKAKQYLLVALLLAVSLWPRHAMAVPTKFTDVQVRNLTVTGNTTVAGTVSQSTGSYTGGLSLAPFTKAQLTTLTSTTTGQYIQCTDCTTASLCVSSGTKVGSWVVAVATGAFAGSTYSGFPGCK